MGYKDWLTPPDFFHQLNEEYHFSLDAAASHENALCEGYCTKDGMFYKFPGGGTPIPVDPDADGLLWPWQAYRVFCNPPYDSSISQWVAKAASREADVAVLLLPPSVDTAWFHDYIWPDKADLVWFLKGRLKFWKDGKPGPSPRAGNLVAVWWGGDVHSSSPEG